MEKEAQKYGNYDNRNKEDSSQHSTTKRLLINLIKSVAYSSQQSHTDQAILLQVTGNTIG
jgi:hypothetical protein